MKTPFSRAAFTILFMGPANSPTRLAADSHQWSSHMSQMIKAVFPNSHSILASTTFWGASFDRDRRVRSSFFSSAMRFVTNTIPVNKTRSIRFEN